MFGGIAFMVAGNMAVGVIKDDLMVRLDPADAERALAEPPRGRSTSPELPAKNMVYVDPSGTGTDEDLGPWVEPAPTSPPHCRRSRSKPTGGALRVAAMADSGSKPGNELFLLDGNSLPYRAFFALPESIATADGRPTNAIYGLASMLGKIVVEHTSRRG